MSRLSAFARTPRGIVTTVVVGSLIIGGGVGAGDALADRSSSPASAGATTPTPSGTPSGHGSKGVHGKIVAATADKLTLREGDGTVLTVLITTKTKFGSKKRPATAAALVPGTRVTVVGPVTGTTVSAQRIVPAMPKAATPAPAASTSPTL